MIAELPFIAEALPSGGSTSGGRGGRPLNLEALQTTNGRAPGTQYRRRSV